MTLSQKSHLWLLSLKRQPACLAPRWLSNLSSVPWLHYIFHRRRLPSSFVHLFLRYLLQAYYVPSTLPGSRDAAGSQAGGNPCPHGAGVLMGCDGSQNEFYGIWVGSVRGKWELGRRWYLCVAEASSREVRKGLMEKVVLGRIRRGKSSQAEQRVKYKGPEAGYVWGDCRKSRSQSARSRVSKQGGVKLMGYRGADNDCRGHKAL